MLDRWSKDNYDFFYNNMRILFLTIRDNLNVTSHRAKKYNTSEIEKHCEDCNMVWGIRFFSKYVH